MERYGFLIDITKCIGCRGCQVACKRWHELPGESTTLSEEWTNPPDLSSKTWTHVRFNFVTGANGGEGVWRFVKTQCMHCEDPSCVSACPVGALYKTDNGPVNYDSSKCIGCRYCIFACPFGTPRYQWDEVRPLVTKCTLCSDRIAEGLKPACATTCPTGAIEFGDRTKLLVEAKARIKNGGNYIDQVYGENEVGGTSVMYISDIPFADLGFANVGNEAPPYLSAGYMSKVPLIIVGGIIALGAISWYTKRRAENEKAKAEEEEKELESEEIKEGD